MTWYDLNYCLQGVAVKECRVRLQRHECLTVLMGAYFDCYVGVDGPDLNHFCVVSGHFPQRPLAVHWAARCPRYKQFIHSFCWITAVFLSVADRGQRLVGWGPLQNWQHGLTEAARVLGRRFILKGGWLGVRSTYVWALCLFLAGYKSFETFN